MLLLEDEQRLVESGLRLRISVAKYFDLRVLAAQTEDRRSRHVGMMNVSRDEPAEIVGIFPCSTASAFMKQEADAVDVFE